jgi:P-type Mg2+ transporter
MRAPKPPIWLPWILGCALLAAVIVAALHYTEQQQIVELMARAQPWWLAAATLLQVFTYVAQAGIYLRVGDAAGFRLSRRDSFGLSVAKLFVDQALPSAGVGTGVLINIASFYRAYVVALIVALAMMLLHGRIHTVVLVTAVISLVFSLLVSLLLLGLSGHDVHHVSERLRRLPLLRGMYHFLAGADPELVRGPRLLIETVLLQLAIVLLDVATVWALIAAFGVYAPLGGVFTSFMIASMVRTMGIVPGGLGTFEASSVLTLRLAGVDLPVALSATLLFRGLSFWLPMLPGWWLAHHAVSPGAGREPEKGRAQAQ